MRRSWVAWVRVGAALTFGVLALAFATERVTSVPALCSSCHQMEERTAEWKESAHSSIGCVECHTSPREWYQFPQSAVEQVALLGRDAYLSMGSKAYAGPLSADGSEISSVPVGSGSIADEVCLQCHDADRKATSGYRILIDHPEHARRNGSCVSCHVRTAHPVPLRGRAMSLMAQCMTCHGTPEQPAASAECAVCHPSGYELRPASHKPADWATEHGRVSQADPKQCSMCHKQDFCMSCHGLQMPHPADWAAGESGHKVWVREDAKSCAKCHGPAPRSCDSCHHKSFDASKGDWVKQHYIEVRDGGAAACFDCHSPAYCVRCHVP